MGFHMFPTDHERGFLKGMKLLMLELFQSVTYFDVYEYWKLDEVFIIPLYLSA